jgi:hypothetical protein
MSAGFLQLNLLPSFGSGSDREQTTETHNLLIKIRQPKDNFNL